MAAGHRSGVRSVLAIALAVAMVGSVALLSSSSATAGAAPSPSVALAAATHAVQGVPGKTGGPLPNSAAPSVGLVGTVLTGSTTTEPYFPVYDPGNGFLYVSDLMNSTVSVINGTALQATIGVGHSPGLGAYDAQNGYVYVPNIGSATVSVINGTTLLTNLSVGNSPILAIYDSSNGYVYVTNDGSRNVSVLDGTSVVGSVDVGDEPLYGTYDSDDGTVYVMNFGSDNVSVINGTSVVGSVNVGGGAYFPTYDPVDNTVYVPNALSYNVSVLQGTSLLGTVGVGEAPQGATYASNGYVYVSNADTNNVSVIQGLSVVANVPVGHGPDYSAYDSAFGYLYVVNVDSNNVTVLNGTHVIANIPVGNDPEYATIDPGTHYVYVPNVGGNTVSVIGPTVPTYPVTFTESGLPSGTYWQANFSGTLSSATTPVIGFAAQNGNYSFSIPTVSGFTTSPSSGNISVNGSAVSVRIVFSLPTPHNLTFRETGLPAATSWSVSVNGTMQSSTTATIVFSEPTGSYAFVVGAVAGYTASPSSGNITLNASMEVDITFTAIPPASYNVTITEDGLPAGTTWSAELNGSTATSNSSSIVFEEVNGTYAFVIPAVGGFTAAPSSGNLTVDGVTNLNVTFSPIPPPSYTVTFTETGLPNGTSWSVSFNGSTASSNTSSIVFEEVNGTYAFVVYAVSGFTATPSSGNLTVDGVTSQVVTFRPIAPPPSFSVTFTESGLPAGTHWSVAIDDMNWSSNGTTVTGSLPNGSYAYSIPTASSYLPTPSSGTVDVVGAPVTTPIAFALPQPQSVTFDESGLPGGSTWVVLVNGVTLVANGPSVTYRAPSPGNYTFYVTTLRNGWVASPASGTVDLSNGSVTVAINFSLSAPSFDVFFTASGIAPGTGWSVDFNGSVVSSTDPTIEITGVEAGSYSYSIGSLAGYTASPPSGNLSVVDRSISIGIDFAPITYTVTFTETGLPAGTHWAVLLNGVVVGSTTSSITFTLAPGTYNYSIGAIPGWSGSPHNGSVTVVASDVSVGITFTDPPLGPANPALGRATPSRSA